MFPVANLWRVYTSIHLRKTTEPTFTRQITFLLKRNPHTLQTLVAMSWSFLDKVESSTNYPTRKKILYFCGSAVVKKPVLATENLASSRGTFFVLTNCFIWFNISVITFFVLYRTCKEFLQVVFVCCVFIGLTRIMFNELSELFSLIYFKQNRLACCKFWKQLSCIKAYIS